MKAPHRSPVARVAQRSSGDTHLRHHVILLPAEALHNLQGEVCVTWMVRDGGMCRAETSRPSIASISTAAWSLTSSKAATSQPGVATTYAVVLKDGVDPSEVKQICSWAYVNLGVSCRSTLQHTVNGFIMQALLHVPELQVEVNSSLLGL